MVRREPWGYTVGECPGSETVHWQTALRVYRAADERNLGERLCWPGLTWSQVSLDPGDTAGPWADRPGEFKGSCRPQLASQVPTH